ncbi:hypothetical protein WG66_006496 [Moniliophthora roreri]|nr:hypothetical protein WG66_006496 [Moniliophthora roreri]
MLSRHFLVTIQTGLITNICVMVDLLSYLLSPSGTHFIFNCVLPKLYTNSLLSSLNSRGGWKLSKSKNTLVEHSQSDISFRSVFIHVESQETVDHP